MNIYRRVVHALSLSSRLVKVELTKVPKSVVGVGPNPLPRAYKDILEGGGRPVKEGEDVTSLTKEST